MAVNLKAGNPLEKSSQFRIAVALVIVLAAIGLAIRWMPDLNWVVEHETSLRNRIESAPIASFVIGMICYIGLSLIPGTAGKSIVFGWLFGFFAAVLMVEIGLTTAAVLSFLLSRYFVGRMLHRRWQIYLRWLRERFAEDGAFYLLSLRMAHAPFTLVNYGAGATNIPLTTFGWTTLLGILPSTLVFTLVGSRIPNLRTVVERGTFAVLDPLLLSVLIVSAFLPLVVAPWFRKKLTKK